MKDNHISLFVEAVVVFLADALLVDNVVDKDICTVLTHLLTKLLTQVLTKLLTQLLTKLLTQLLTKLLTHLLTKLFTQLLRRMFHRHPHWETDISSRVRTMLEPSEDGDFKF